MAESGAVAQDPSTGRIYVAQPASDDVFVVAPGGGSIVTVLSVPGAPSSIAIDASRHLAYVASDAAGMVIAFDTVSFRPVRVLAVGGHPTAIALAAGGKTLLVSDGYRGAVTRLALQPGRAGGANVLSIGPGSQPIIAPATAAIGDGETLWARGFAPGEPVNVYWVYWGSAPLARAVANAGGYVTATFQVPPHVGTGRHMVIVYGRRSAISESVLVNVVARPTPRRRQVKPHRVAQLPPLVRKLLAPSIAIPNPLSLLGHSSRPHHRASRASPIQVPLIALAFVLLVLIAARAPRVLRRRKARRLERQSQPNPVGKSRGSSRRRKARSAA